MKKSVTISFILLIMIAFSVPAIAKQNDNWIPPGHRVDRPAVNKTPSQQQQQQQQQFSNNVNINKSISDGSSKADADAAANSDASSGSNLTQGNINSGNISVAAPIPGGVGYGPTINYFGQPLPSEGFQPIEMLVMYSCYFTEGALMSMLKGTEDADVELKIVNPIPEGGNFYNVRVDGQKWIKIVVQREKLEDVKLIGFVTARSEDNETTMVEVMAKAALKALRQGCNVIQFTAQGAVRDVFSTGWGVGLNTTQAQIYDSAARSNVTSGGLGYSSAKAGMRDKPWLQGFALIDKNEFYPQQ